MSVIEAAGAAGARLRHARLLHPRGVSFTGELQTVGTPGHTWHAALLDEPARRPATVRVSKGGPTPTGWPDVLGLAIRVVGDDGRVVDLLLSSAARPPVLRHFPAPRRDFGGSYGTMLAYRAGSHRLFLSTVPAPGLGATLDDVERLATGPGVRLRIAAATRWDLWKPVAELRFGTRLPDAVDDALAFNPAVNHPADLVPVGVLQQARRWMYRGSQVGRGKRFDSPDPG